ncbi:MAG: hypothetical protein RLZZ528_1226 [Pseudomonadota bacterium]
MSKGNNRRGNKEVKKPKADKPKKTTVTVDSFATRPALVLGGKKVG